MKQDSMVISPLQYLRALAAGIVVISHAGHQASIIYDTSERIFNFGAIGVDIFFIISGFIMMLVSEKREANPVFFLVKRFIRIMPVYWFTVALYIGLDFAFDELKIVDSLDQILKSLVIWGTVDGKVIIGVAWTLRFEWIFYGCFAIALLISPRNRAVLAGLGLFIVIAALNYHRNDGGLLDQMRSWSGGFYEFMFGMAAYTVWKGNEFFHERKLIASQIASGALVLAMLAASVLFLYQFGEFGGWRPAINHKQLSWGLPALVVFSGWLALFSRVRISGFADKLLLHYGDASFTLYLIHFPILIILRGNDRLAPLWAATGFWGFIILASAAAFAVSSIVYFAVEKPLLSFLRKRLLPKPPAISKA